MDDPDWLTPEQLHAWIRLVSVVELLPGTLDSQLRRDAELSHFEYLALAMLSEAPERTLRMTALSAVTNSTLARLSHVIARLEKRGFVARTPCAEDRRATNASLTELGWQKVLATAPGHVVTVRDSVIDVLDGQDIADLDRIMGRILSRLDPTDRLRGRGTE
jgi:DNA-binding MarR family transcriptional regulator